MKLLVVLSILIHLSRSDDMIRDHLNQFIDRSISPCDDFYHHVCSRNMNGSDGIMSKSQQFYSEIISKLGLPKTADSVLYNKSLSAYEYFRSKDSDKVNIFDCEKFGNIEVELCGSNKECLAEKFLLYYAIIGRLSELISFLLPFANMEPLDISKLNGNSTEISKKVCEHVNGLIGQKKKRYVKDAVRFYSKLHERIAFIEYLKEDGIEKKLPLKRMNHMAKLVRGKIRETLEETIWVEGIVTFPGGHGLNATAVLDSIHFLNEEIPSELNTTSLRNLSKIYTEIYEEENRMRVNSGCEECDDLAVFLPTYKRLQIELHHSYDMDRTGYSGTYNAWFHPTEPHLYVQEPVYYPLLDCNSTTNDLLAASFVLAHEFHHSLISPDLRSVSREFDEQATCLIKHYQNTCAKFGTERCDSGVSTFDEDGPDSAGIRVIVDVMKDIYGDSIDMLEYPDLGITKRQALFYGIAATNCVPEQENVEYSDDVHSLSRMRVNGMFSQLADFASAFSCRNGDRMVIPEDQVCYLFGEFA